MTHLPAIINDLAFMLIVAGVVTIIFKWLKQPIVLGYIIAGFLTGPHFDFFPTVQDTESIHIWGEIGVIFLLFGMGLEFSFKKLIKNGKTGFITLLIIIIGLGVSGYFLGMWMGWGHWNSLILGSMLCLSSTTIIVKGFDDPKYKGQHFTEVVFGILIFDDLFAILVMVFLGTIAVSTQFEGTEILLSIGKLLFFMIVWIVGGIFIVPTFLKKVKRWLNDETLLIVSLGLCLAMVVFATKVELSSALGAFIMGSILAETIDLEHIERVTKPIKDFFGAIFFVSVGMMMDPQIVVDNFSSILYISGLVLFGKIIFTAIGARWSGETMLTSVQSGFSMAQVGEFAFIVAGTAIAYKLADGFIYPIIIAVSVLTTFTTPYLMAVGPGAYNLMMRKIPVSWKERIIAKDKRLGTPSEPSVWGAFVKSYILNIIIFVSLGIAVVLVALTILSPFISTYMNPLLANIITLVLTLLALAPILKGLIYYKGREQPFLILTLWKHHASMRFVLSSLIVVRYIIAFAFVYFVFWKLLESPIWLTAIAAVFLFLIFMRSKFLLKLYWNMEYRFVVNFNQRLIEDKRKISQAKDGVTAFAFGAESFIEQNLYIGRFSLEASSDYEDKMLKDTDFRSRYGILIVDVYRDSEELIFPNGDFVLKAGDILTVVGNIMQINRMARDKNKITLNSDYLMPVHAYAKIQDEDPDSQIKLLSMIIDEDSGLYGKSLLESEMGSKGRAFVVGIEKSSGYEINPSASTVLQKDDIIWIVGCKESLFRLLQVDFHF